MLDLLAAAAEDGGVHEALASPIALIVIGAAAFTLPIIARRVRVPAIVLEILFGVIVGPEVLGVIQQADDQEAIALLAELGLLLLMFLAGLEVDFERIERQGSMEIVFGVGIVGGIGITSWLGTGLLDLAGTNQRMFITLLLTAASVGIVIPALRDTRRTATRLGQVILITAVLAEFASLVGIIVLGVIVEQGGLTPQVLAIPALFAIMGAILLIIRRAAWWYPERFERFFEQHDPDELGIRASLALLLVFVGISVALGIEAILGAFLAGTVFGFVFRNTGTLEERLGGFSYGFFIPIFFINVGITFPLSELGDPEVLGQAAILIGIGVVAKVLPSLVLVTRGFSIRSALAAGLLLAGQLSVIIALADFGLRLDLITSGLRAGAILLVAVTAVLSPVTFRLLAPPLPDTEAAEAAVD